MRPRRALNPRPPDYMSGALPSELPGPTSPLPAITCPGDFVATATTVKNFISTDSPQYKEHITTIQIQIFQTFFIIRNIYNIFLQTIFRTTPALSNARCCCTEYYKYSRISPKHHTWLEIQNSITIIRGYLFGISKFVSTFIFLHAALLA